MNQTHDFSATFHQGIVSEVDDARHRVRVRLPALNDMETDWLAVVTPYAGTNGQYALPDEGVQVVCILDARGECGCVLGATYNEQDTPPAASRDIWCRTFADGTRIEHNRRSGVTTISGCTQLIITCPDNQINGNVTVTGGNITVNGGDVTADGISLKTHTHGGVAPGGGSTSTPS